MWAPYTVAVVKFYRNSMNSPLSTRTLHYHPGSNTRSIKAIKWDQGNPNLKECSLSEIIFKKGDLLEIPTDVPHCIYADPKEGCIFHELVGDFKIS